MPFQNRINQHLTPAQRTQLFGLIEQIENLLQPHLHNLSAEENRKLGHISERNMLLVNKVNDYHRSQPALQSPDVDWAEFEADMQSRTTYKQATARLQALTKAMTETRRLHDHDVFKNATIDYHYAKYKDRTDPGVGYDSKVEELKQFFPDGKNRSIPDQL
jgi:hypothetical protein